MFFCIITMISSISMRETVGVCEGLHTNAVLPAEKIEFLSNDKNRFASGKSMVDRKSYEDVSGSEGPIRRKLEIPL